MAEDRTDANGTGRQRILVVDDEDNITHLVATALRYEHFDVEVAATGRAALDTAATFRPDLLVLDIMLPDLDGFEVHRRLINAGGHIPAVLYLTARESTADKVRGLTMGADDYVAKPFSLEELVARVRAVLRRGGRHPGQADCVLGYADLEMNEDTREVSRAGEPIELTPREFALLRYLLVNARRVLSKQQILDHVWQYDYNGDAAVVETYMSYLRRKIDNGGPPLIHTLRGVGYSLRLPKT